MRVLVTGASGFLGKEIVKLLLEKDYEVVCLSNNTKIVVPDVNFQKVKSFQIDLSDKHQLYKIPGEEKVDVIIHCAGLAHQFGKKDKDAFQKVNVSGTRNICNLAIKLGAKRFILISSVSVYGNTDSNIENPITEDIECGPKGFYAESKLESEIVCKDVCFDNDIDLTILRPATIIGEGDRGNVYRLVNLIHKGYFFWLGHGTNYKSLIYKRDIAEACLEILRKSNEKFEVYNLSANALTMKEIVGEISLTLNKKNKYITFPEKIPRLIFNLNRKTLNIKRFIKFEETFRKWKSDEVFSSNLIKEKYGFKPQVSVKEAIRLETKSYLEE